MNHVGFILAAGFGTRMRELTADLPKPLLPVNGVPLLHYALFNYHLWGIEKIYLNVHYKPDAIIDRLRNYPYAELVFSKEEAILGTAGGIHNAGTSIDETLILRNPDTILFPQGNDAPDTAFVDQKKATSLLYIARKGEENQETGIEFIESDASSGPIRFVENGDCYYVGYSILHPDIFAAKRRGEKYELGPLWRRCADEKKLYGRVLSGIFYDCGTLSDYLAISGTDIVPDPLRIEWNRFLSGLPG